MNAQSSTSDPFDFNTAGLQGEDLLKTLGAQMGWGVGSDHSGDSDGSTPEDSEGDGSQQAQQDETEADPDFDRIREEVHAKAERNRQTEDPHEYPIPPISGPADCAPIRDWISNTPPPQKWVLQGIIQERVVGVLSAAGGVGKSNLSLLMALVIATGKGHGPFLVPNPQRVLILNVEDPQEEMHRRVHYLAKQFQLNDSDGDALDNNLLIFPGRGLVGPLMEFDGINPSETEWAAWLSASVMAMRPALTILDTKSRLYGLDENSTDHNTQWLRLLEKISTETGSAFLIIHHNRKDGRKELNIDAARGGGSLTDNCRFTIMAAPLDEKDGKKFGLSDWGRYFKVQLVNGNYSPSAPIWYFKRGQAGVPIPVDLRAERIQAIAKALVELLRLEDPPLTRRELIHRLEGKEIRHQMKEDFDAKTQDLEAAVDFALQEGMVQEVTLGRGSAGGSERVVLQPTAREAESTETR